MVKKSADRTRDTTFFLISSVDSISAWMDKHNQMDQLAYRLVPEAHISRTHL